MQQPQQIFNQERQAHWDRVARKLEHWTGWGSYYQKRVSRVYQFNIPPQQDILEIGCGSGNLIASLEPAYGLGLDISNEMIRCAKRLHPQINFIQSDAFQLEITRKFDFVILSDTINDLWDVQTTLENIHHVLKADGRLVINLFNRLWEFPLKVAASLNAAKPMLPQNWLTVEDTSNLLDLASFETLRHWEEVLMPLPIPLLDEISNKFLVRFWPFHLFAMTHFLVARKKSAATEKTYQKSVSIIIPARNEAGNIRAIFERTPQIGSKSELIFVEGHSTDDTLLEIQNQIKEHPAVTASVYKQEGKGKGDAVRLGFSRASGEILMILDADLTMPPEFLPRFYDALVSGVGDFVNGVRLVYPMEKRAMRFFNLIGNKLFSLIFSYLLGQSVKDTLCGTKALWKKDYETIAKNRGYFGDFDPFGDFDLIFGAAKLNLKIVDMPIRYRERVYGETNIQRWRHGWLLIKMVWFAARRIKFT